MAEVINLRVARKRAKGERKEAEAAARRAAFGRTKEERIRTQDSKTRTDLQLDHHRLEKDET